MSLLSNYKQYAAQDLLSSVVVFLVAIPLCLGIAIACGVPPALGLISGIIGGLVVGTFAGCPLQVSGPAAGLITIVWEIIEKHGMETFGFIVLCGGILQIILGLLGFGRWFRAVSPSVIQGMLSGIGILIFASRFHVMLDDTPLSSGVSNLLMIPQAIYKGVLPVDGSSHHIAAFIGMLTIGTIIAWGFMPSKLKMIPAALVGVVVATVVASIFQFPINYVSVPENLFSDLTIINFNQFNRLMDPSILLSIITLSFIASAESLLTATAVDRMRGGVPTVYNKEMVAQGIGNTIAGCIGALPITGVIVRSSANVQAGGQTRISTLLHGFWILVFVIALPFILNQVPVSSLAAVLVYTGYRLINFKGIGELLKYGKSEVAIYATTVITIVTTDLLIGIMVGIVLSAARLLYVLTHLDIRIINKKDAKKDDSLDVKISGSATFFTLPILAETLENLPQKKKIRFFLEDLNYVDHACLELLLAWEKQYTQQGGQIIMEWSHVMDRLKRPKTNNANTNTESAKDFTGITP